MIKIFFFVILILGISIAQQQPIPPQQGPQPYIELIPIQNTTHKNFPTPEEVLVVYANNIFGDSSKHIKAYQRLLRSSTWYT
ncbi:MAG: hypothetical protein COT22_01260 [Ignavibacteria bacterium CG08_land_8_20_14_0_20_37_9]|nr:MAG: hypothetical protein AUJ54_04665 [Ignavibacteria bacterium CG1_02_37_35]PIS46190.1 MAG: hypothetical protein COT22_01260 [Ignavibacteria bacterium CG08_land_8_20_14_0_20_37_9]PIX93362.1 MAG: hypothetical protein COZ25_11060 [Ignavibacteria bacterium CG_4_10_14_3_um_filter_37_18]